MRQRLRVDVLLAEEVVQHQARRRAQEPGGLSEAAVPPWAAQPRHTPEYSCGPCPRCVRLIMLERSDPPEAPGTQAPWTAEFEPVVLGGLRGTSVIATWFESEDSVDVSRPFAARVDLGRATGTEREFSLIVHPPTLPQWLIKNSFGLLRPYEEPVALWPQMPLPADPVDSSLSLRTYSYSAPWLSVMVRGLSALLGV